MLGGKDREGLPTTEGVNAFVGRRTAFQGKIRFEGLFRIDGKYDGEILSGDSLFIGETGEVNGQINVQILVVNGKVNGNIKAAKRIEIHSPGEILGDIQTPVLVISEGAVFVGNCQMEKMRGEKISSLKARESESAEVEEGKKGDVGSETT